MTIVVNGHETSVEDGLAVADLMNQLGLKPERLAVELNRKIIRRSDWLATRLNDGDRVEIVHFVGGGSGIGLKRQGQEGNQERCLTH